MGLHVHIQLVLVVENATAFAALISRIIISANAVLTARRSIAFEPLIAAETAVGAPVATFGAVPPHG
jgi:hypothetical protein